MHELALSESIVASVLNACGVEAGRVRRIAVRVGALSSANVDSLEFCLRMVLDHRGLRDAEAAITRVPARIRCECGRCYTTEDMFEGCPDCGGYRREVLEGTDVTVEYVEVEDEEG